MFPIVSLMGNGHTEQIVYCIVMMVIWCQYLKASSKVWIACMKIHLIVADWTPCMYYPLYVSLWLDCEPFYHAMISERLTRLCTCLQRWSRPSSCQRPWCYPKHRPKSMCLGYKKRNLTSSVQMPGPLELSNSWMRLTSALPLVNTNGLASGSRVSLATWRTETRPSTNRGWLFMIFLERFCLFLEPTFVRTESSVQNSSFPPILISDHETPTLQWPNRGQLWLTSTVTEQFWQPM